MIFELVPMQADSDLEFLVRKVRNFEFVYFPLIQASSRVMNTRRQNFRKNARVFEAKTEQRARK